MHPRNAIHFYHFEEHKEITENMVKLLQKEKFGKLDIYGREPGKEEERGGARWK